jgi:hypothetical protein
MFRGSTESLKHTNSRTVVVVTSLTSSHHTIRGVIRNEYSEVTIKHATKDRISFFHCKQGIQLINFVKTNYFNF